MRGGRRYPRTSESSRDRVGDHAERGHPCSSPLSPEDADGSSGGVKSSNRWRVASGYDTPAKVFFAKLGWWAPSFSPGIGDDGSAFDGEATGGGQRRDIGGGDVLDVVGDGGFDGDFVEEGIDFLAFAHDQEFDGALGEVADGADDVEAFGEVFGGVAEADALDTAFEDDAL